ncbi:hypothetical protein [Nocardia australiensis]|uniref:hypothetical protein n=1 Tax=Nocardia australiensis TaxID=2887191 RepID=UPI001D142439|nr:hypothetical protein [Nocardia australiensis]
MTAAAATRWQRRCAIVARLLIAALAMTATAVFAYLLLQQHSPTGSPSTPNTRTVTPPTSRL